MGNNVVESIIDSIFCLQKSQKFCKYYDVMNQSHYD